MSSLARLVFLVVAAGLACQPSEPVTAPSDKTKKREVPDAAGPTTSSQTPDAAPPAGGKTLFVREMLVDCEGERPMKCMQVRESETDEWTLLYGSIEGFTYEPGFLYELRVDSMTTSRPAADRPSRRPRLLGVVGKKKNP